MKITLLSQGCGDSRQDSDHNLLQKYEGSFFFNLIPPLNVCLVSEILKENLFQDMRMASDLEKSTLS